MQIFLQRGQWRSVSLLTPSSLWQLLIPRQLMPTVENRRFFLSNTKDAFIFHVDWTKSIITRTWGAKLLPQVLHWISFWMGGASPSATRNQTVVPKATHFLWNVCIRFARSKIIMIARNTIIFQIFSQFKFNNVVKIRLACSCISLLRNEAYKRNHKTQLPKRKAGR